ncbi:odorant receptor 67d-like [Bradysia coprophila]|uniref:odorant receptor 67d-like n=1 Tax=Bradysia coprophila TaxID=38358 RepID=UPI00187D8D9A|nr:odorant receptor 67d-like [Bradysia coprophila]
MDEMRESVKKIKSTKKVDGTANNTKCESEALKQIVNFIEFFGKVLGWKCSYDWTGKGNLRHCFTVLLVIFFWTQVIYTQISHFVNGEYKRILEVCAVYGGGASCGLRVRCFIKFNKNITALHNFSFKITRQAGSLAEQIEKQQRQNLKLYKLICMIEVSSLLVFSYNPLKSYILRGEYLSLLPIEMIFIDQTQLSGFLIANAIMSVMGVVLVWSSMFIAMNFVASISNYSIQVDLIESDIKQLDALWENKKATNLSERYSFLRNICQKCQDKDNFIAEVKNIFDETIFYYFSIVYISQIICLYEIEMEDWMPGYGLAYGMFVEMLFHCCFGTKVTIINDRMYYILIQCKWYTYDLHSQKIYLDLLNSNMNAQELWIGPLAPLSVTTGIQIVKSIYSYYTFLAEAV